MGSLAIGSITKINIASLLKVDKYIKQGSSIGFFPEGTINREPDKMDLLPIASDAVFQLAKRNECWLQPFSIVWMDLEKGIPNKVAVAFGNAIEASGLTTEEIREKWEREIRMGIEGLLCRTIKTKV